MLLISLVDWIDALVRGAVVVLLLLLCMLLSRERPTLPMTRVASALALGMCVQVLASTPLVEQRLFWLWQVPLIAISVGNAVLFWVFVKALFDDNFRYRHRYVLAWIGAAALSAWNCLSDPGDISPWILLTRASQRAIPVACAILASLAAARHWRADLVESRRRWRVFILTSGVVYCVLIASLRWIAPQGRLVGYAALLDASLYLVIVVTLAVRLLRLAPTDLTPSAPRLALADSVLPPQTPATRRPEAALEPEDPADLALGSALNNAMTGQRAYVDEDLSVATLAERLAVPEYRLRRHINQRLGHRNFNAYVNSFRLAEVRAALADPAKCDLPILTIALTAGFQSIGPFNRAFKADTGLTPTEFRQQHQAES